MRTLVSVILCLVFVLSPLAAQELRSLESRNDGKNWMAVGRLVFHEGRGFCTATLVSPTLVLTAAHCLYDTQTRDLISVDEFEFQAGFRNGRAEAYRKVRRAVAHPEFKFAEDNGEVRVRHDVALIELQRPIQSTSVIPMMVVDKYFATDKVGIVSYARGRTNAPSLQNWCTVKAQQSEVMVMTCDVDYGASGSPVFLFDGENAFVVSVVSAMATTNGERVSLSASLRKNWGVLLNEMEYTRDLPQSAGAQGPRKIGRNSTGAKFVKP